MYANFGADNEINNSSIGNKTTKIYLKNTVLNSYETVSDFEDVLKSGHHKSP